MNATVEKEEVEVVEQPDYEQDARAQGWRPQEEYEGDNWVDAKTFVERGKKFVGIAVERADRIEKQLKYQQQVNSDFKRYLERQEVLHQKQLAAMAKDLERARKQAITNGDGEAFDKADKQLAEVKEQQTVVTQSQEQKEPPAWANDWMQQNSWYGKDKAATAVAEQYAKELRQAQPFLEGQEFMDTVAEYVKTELPHKFENKKKKQIQEVEVDTTVSTKSTAKTYNAMPPEAKKEFNRLVKEGIFKATDEGRAKYADLYFE